MLGKLRVGVALGALPAALLGLTGCTPFSAMMDPPDYLQYDGDPAYARAVSACFRASVLLLNPPRVNWIGDQITATPGSGNTVTITGQTGESGPGAKHHWTCSVTLFGSDTAITNLLMDPSG